MLSLFKKKCTIPQRLFNNINLLESSMTRVAHIELTSRCNISCVYCAASHPDYKGADIEILTLENIINGLKKRGVRNVCVNGHGETTLYKDWNLYCNQMIQEGMSLAITTNFSRDFTIEEIDTLTQFKSIEISCDTNDPILFKKLRRGNDLRMVCLNISRILTIAAKKWRTQPALSFSCVVSDQNIFHLKEYVEFAKELGISYFNFCNLIKYPDLKNALNPIHITELPRDMLVKAQESLLETIAYLEDSGLKYNIQQGLLDSVNYKLNELITPVVPDTEKINEPRHYYSPQKKGLTRNCIDPWEFVMISSTAEVFPCCGHPPICTLGKEQPFVEVFNNLPIKILRKQLLTGELPDFCLRCTRMGWTTTQNLQKRVEHYLSPNKNPFIIKRSTIDLTTLTPSGIIYEKGWYEWETDLNVNDPEKQQWRWTSQKANCRLVNPGTEAILVLKGTYPQAIIPELRITLNLNSVLLDKFCFHNSTVYIEYVIPYKRMGESKEVNLEIFVENTFFPSIVNPGSSDHRELGIQIFSLVFGQLR